VNGGLASATTMKKLVCDRCGKELTEEDDLDLALEGRQAWAAAARARGTEPRGIIPCGNFVRCGGEMVLVDDSRIAQWRQRLGRAFRKKENSNNEAGGLI
jgi:hypothetical protein